MQLLEERRGHSSRVTVEYAVVLEQSYAQEAEGLPCVREAMERSIWKPQARTQSKIQRKTAIDTSRSSRN